MGVGSYFEFVVLAFGWIVYDGVWAVLNDTGIVYLPFLGIVVKNVIESKRGGDDEGSAAVQSLKKIEVDTVIAVVVVFLAAVPSFPLEMAQMRYVRPSLECGAGGGGIVTAGDAAAPYGPIRAQLAGTEAEIPLWWAAMHQLGRAVAAGALAGIPCSSDVRGLHMRIGREAIDDPAALESMRRFAGECHRRAVALWAEGHGLAGSADCAAAGELPAPGGCVPRLPGGASAARPELSRADEIKASFDYPGSAWLARTIYPALQSTVDLSGLGWARTLPRDAIRPSGAYPACGDWWTGLRAQLLAGLDADMVADATDPTPGPDGRPLGWYARPVNAWPHETPEDAVLAAVLDGRFRAPADSGDGFGRTLSYNASFGERMGSHGVRVERAVDAGEFGTAAKKLLQGGGALIGGAVADLVAVAGAGVKSLAWARRGRGDPRDGDDAAGSGAADLHRRAAVHAGVLRLQRGQARAVHGGPLRARLPLGALGCCVLARQQPRRHARPAPPGTDPVGHGAQRHEDRLHRHAVDVGGDDGLGGLARPGAGRGRHEPARRRVARRRGDGGGRRGLRCPRGARPRRQGGVGGGPRPGRVVHGAERAAGSGRQGGVGGGAQPGWLGGIGTPRLRSRRLRTPP